MLASSVFQQLGQLLVDWGTWTLLKLWDIVQYLLWSSVDLIATVFNRLRVMGDWMMDYLFTKAATAFPILDVSPWHSTIDQINFIFPLSETVTMTTAFVALWACMLIFRLVKMCIPTAAT